MRLGGGKKQTRPRKGKDILLAFRQRVRVSLCKLHSGCLLYTSSYAEHQAEKTGTSWKGKLKIAVDALIPQVSNFEELSQRLQAAGYEIKPGKYVSCRAPGQERLSLIHI